jgi:hypothetical protein
MNKKQAASKTPAKEKKGIDPSYYENHCFADDFIQAKKDGNLIIPKKGESTLQAVKRHFEEKKKTTAVSMRVPVYIVNMAKAQAKAAGVPYTSFMVAALERAMAKTARRLA